MKKQTIHIVDLFIARSTFKFSHPVIFKKSIKRTTQIVLFCSNVGFQFFNISEKITSIFKKINCSDNDELFHSIELKVYELMHELMG